MTTTDTPTVDKPLSVEAAMRILMVYVIVGLAAFGYGVYTIVSTAFPPDPAPTGAMITVTVDCPDGTTRTVDLAVADDRTVNLADDLDDSCAP